MSPQKSADQSFWLDSLIRKAQKAHRFFFRLLCCCGLGKKCFCHSPEFYAGKVEANCCCFRDIYAPTSKCEDEYGPLHSSENEIKPVQDLLLNLAWFAPGSSIQVILLEQGASFCQQDLPSEMLWSCEYPQGQEKSEEYSLVKCVKVKRREPKTRNRLVFRTFVEALILKIREAQQIHPVSVLSITMQPKLSPEFLKETLEKDFLKAKLCVDLLTVDGNQCEDVSVFWNLIEFKHLAISAIKPIFLTDKMMSCGFLSLHAPLINPEALSSFKGFGLIVEDTIFSILRLIEEVEKMKSSSTSTLQLISILFLTKGAYEQASSELLQYSSSGAYQEFEFSYESKFSLIPLEEGNVNGSAIFKKDNLISFAVGDWKKWAATIAVMQKYWGVLHVPQ